VDRVVTPKTLPSPRNGQTLRLGIAGRIAEDDHPFSWSAILNGYDPQAMRRYADPAIGAYLEARSPDEFGIAGVQVTHVWADHDEDARRIAQASRIPHVVASAEDLIGKVDAILIPTDIGREHLRRARAFIEAGLPVFIDKPLVEDLADLAIFEQWAAQGRPIASSSAMRYAPAFVALRQSLGDIGDIKLIQIAMAKSWMRYGIHALEAIHPLLPAGGWLDAVHIGGDPGSDIVQYRHACGAIALVSVIEEMMGGFGCLEVYGTRGRRSAQYGDSFVAFKSQLADFISYVRTGVAPVPFASTAEIMRMLIAGRTSREQQGARISLRA
jgi:predicted dehydrogenase